MKADKEAATHTTEQGRERPDRSHRLENPEESGRKYLCQNQGLPVLLNMKSLAIMLSIMLLTGCLHPQGAANLDQQATLPGDHSVVYIAHVNDTHSHLDAIPRKFILNGNSVTAPVGGYPRVHAQVAAWRAAATEENAGFLFLHAGDTFQGSGYFMLFHGEPEAEMWNRADLDAMVLGNHEFDALRAMDIQRDEQGGIRSVTPGPSLPAGQKLAEFIKMTEFPVLAANMHIPESSPLFGLSNLVPWVVIEVDQEPVGIFGIVLSDMPTLTFPGKELVFLPEADMAQEMVDLLTSKGVNRVIMLSHIGYDLDLKIARAVDGIDVIVGGHTHSVLGDFSTAGLPSDGPYPTMVTTPSGAPCVVVHAGAYAAMAGLLRVVFDARGEVISAEGANHLLVLADPGGSRHIGFSNSGLAPESPHDIPVGTGAVLSWGHENALDREFLDQTYKADIQAAYGPVIATVTESLNHERIPSDPAGHGSAVAPLTAEALAFGLSRQGVEVDFALVNAGSVRTSIPAGPFRENQTMLEIMIFANRVATVELTGAQVKAVLESLITAALDDPQRDGRFPYPARLRYVYDPARPEGRRLHSLAVLRIAGDKGETWRPLDNDNVYRVATTSYIASGKDGYDLLKQYADANGSLQEFDTLDNRMFMDYVQSMAKKLEGRFPSLDYTPVTLKQPLEAAAEGL